MTIVAGVGASAADVIAALAAKANAATPFFTGTSTHQIIHATGAVTFDLGLSVAGAISGTTVATSGNATVGGTLGATGNLSVGSNTAVNPAILINGNGTGQTGIRFLNANVNRFRLFTGNTETGINNTGSDLFLQASTDAGALNTLSTWTRSSGLFQHNAQALVNWQPSTDAADGQFAFTGVATHTAGRAAVAGGKLSANNAGYVYSATPPWVTSTPYVVGQVVAVGYNLMTATSAGTSGVTTPTCSSVIPTSSDGVVSWSFLGIKGGATYQLVGGFAQAVMASSYGGTTTGKQGGVFGLNTQANVTAANGVFVIGYEMNYGASQPIYNRVGQQIIAGVAGTQQGSIDDVGWRILSQRDGAGGGAAPLRHLMCWGGRTGGMWIDPNGYGLRCWGSGWSEPGGVGLTQGAGAIDMTEFQASGFGYFGGGFAWRSRGAKIVDSGDIQSTWALIHGTATGATLDANQYQATGAAVHGGSSGTGWGGAGGLAYCTDGSIVKITAVVGGAVTGISLVYGAFSSSPPGTVTATSENLYGPADDAGNATLPGTFQVDLTAVLANGGAPVLTLGGVATVAISPTGGATAVGGSLAVTGTITGPTTTQAVDTNTTALASTAFVLGQVGTATPLINGIAAAGTSKRWTPIDHVHPTDTTRAAVTGTTFTGAVAVGTATTQQTLTMNGPAGAQRNTVWSTAGVRRWQLAASGTAELGANAGSDLIIQAFDDTGTLLSTPITVTRSTGTVTFGALAKLAAFTVASLPAAAGNTGAVAYVTDATTPTYRGALVGGGAVKCMVFCDGTAWTSQ